MSIRTTPPKIDVSDARFERPWNIDMEAFFSFSFDLSEQRASTGLRFVLSGTGSSDLDVIFGSWRPEFTAAEIVGVEIGDHVIPNVLLVDIAKHPRLAIPVRSSTV